MPLNFLVPPGQSKWMPLGLPFLFVHIPKNAGTYIKQYFNMTHSCHRTAQDFYFNLPLCVGIPKETHAYGRRMGYIGSESSKPWTVHFNAKGRDQYERDLTTYLDICRNNTWDPFEAAYKFSVVRNPWDRLSSIYWYHRDRAELELEHQSFEGFIEDLKQHRGLIFGSDSKSLLKLTQSQYLNVGVEFAGETISTIECGELYREGTYPLNSQELSMNYVATYEKLDEHLEQMIADLPLPLPDSFSKPSAQKAFNRSTNKRFSFRKNYKTFEMIYAVFKYYYDDIRTFNYTFTGVSTCAITEACYNRFKEETNSGVLSHPAYADISKRKLNVT